MLAGLEDHEEHGNGIDLGDPANHVLGKFDHSNAPDGTGKP